MIVPLWAILGIIIALLQAMRPLLQERYKAQALSVSIGNKMVIAIASLPLVLWQGLPDNPTFYLAIAVTSIMWCISDIAYFNTVEKYGAGTVSRILPSAIIVSFLLWFAFEPVLFMHYAERPWISLGIAACIVVAAYCSSHLSRCTVSRNAFRTLWPTFAAATLGPAVTKLILQSAPAAQTIFAFAFVESSMMVFYYSLFITGSRMSGTAKLLKVTRDFKWRALFTANTIKLCLAIGLIMVFVQALRAKAMLNVDNPAYVTVLAHTDVLWIILIYKLIGRKETGNIAAGLGIVACAALLVLLKSLG